MNSGFKVVVQPDAEPITIEECRAHLRLDAEGSPPEHPDDALVLAMLSAAREYAEVVTGRSLVARTVELALDEFPLCGIELPHYPVVSVDSVKYIDTDGVEQTLAEDGYTFDDYGYQQRVVQAFEASWPTTRCVPNAVKVRYVVGHSMPGDSPQVYPLPEPIRAAMLLTLGHLYENREGSVVGVSVNALPLGVASLLQPYRVRLGV